MLKSIAFFSLIALAFIAFALTTFAMDFDDIQILDLGNDMHSYTQSSTVPVAQSDLPLS